MTSWLALFARWSVRQKLKRVSSVQLRRSIRVFSPPTSRLAGGGATIQSFHQSDATFLNNELSLEASCK